MPDSWTRQPSPRRIDTRMGFGAGVMLAATSCSVIIPALETAADQGAGSWLAGGIVGGGIILGALGLLMIERVVPHEHFVKGLEGGARSEVNIEQATKLKRVWLFVTAIVLHNFPEGMAIGVSFAGPDLVGAKALAVGIAIQDIPEGFVFALALICVGSIKGLSLGVLSLSGLFEPVPSLLSFALIVLAVLLLPWLFWIRARAMPFLVSLHFVLSSHRVSLASSH